MGKGQGYNSRGSEGTKYAACMEHDGSWNKRKAMSVRNKWQVSCVISSRMAC